MYKLSIIIPVYNVAGYLEACLDSIYSQITPECQVILVDDGSTDSSGEICDKYGARYPDTFVIHQENKGQGGARNNGVSASSGEYLFFVDSDDTIEPDAIKTALDDIEKYGADMVIYPMKVVSEGGGLISIDSDPFPTDTVMSPENEKRLITAAPAPWNKIIRASLFRENGIEFPSRVWYEDLRTIPKLICKSRSVVLSKRPLYNYLRREGSTMNNAKVERNIEIVSALDDLIEWFKSENLYEKYRSEVDFLLIDHVLLTATVRVIRSVGTSHPLIAKFRAYAEENCIDMRHNEYISQMPKNRRLVLKLIFAKLYFAVSLIFRIKK